VDSNTNSAFAVWVTGLPASGKSTLVSSLKTQLAMRGVDVEVLESDALRRILTPQPNYDEQERDTFYGQMLFIGELLIKHGVSVIFDATANRRTYRDQARRRLVKFLEVYVDCPLEVCIARDPKGIYRQGAEGKTRSVPGLQEPYEAPEKPDVIVHGDTELPESAALKIIRKLIENGMLPEN
jgi:adenylylsulfate kinase